MKKPHFIIKRNLQKSKTTNVYFQDIITEEILVDVCEKVTGCREYTYEFVGNSYNDDFLEATYNKGRIAVLLYEDVVTYITFSELGIEGRNSSVQSVSTAYNKFYNCDYDKKRLCYYFLDCEGNAETDYLVFMYRLMRTVGFEFLNPDSVLAQKIHPFTSINDIITSRMVNKGKNKSNNSTYITKSSATDYEIYGKTYGANKYETAMISYAISLLAYSNENVVLFEVMDGSLKELPKSCLDVINKMGIINVIPTNRTLERIVYNKFNSLRSPRFTFNLLEKFGYKKCAFCDCEVPELIEGAHIWPVSEIKTDPLSNDDQKLYYATSGDNGLWLCGAHHKLFDEDIISININGDIYIRENLDEAHFQYVKNNTTVTQLPEEILTDEFKYYVIKRYKN